MVGQNRIIPLAFLAILLHCLTFCTGCVSNFRYYSGLCPKLSEKKPKGVLVSKGDYYEANLIGNGTNLIRVQHKKGSSIIFSSDVGESPIVSVGPCLILPLAIIPWPVGIWKSFKQPPQEELLRGPITISIKVNCGTWDDCILDPSKIDVWSDPAGIQLDVPNIENYYSGLIKLPLNDVPPNLRKISIKVREYFHNGEKLEVPQIDFVRGKGIRSWCLPTFNG